MTGVTWRKAVSESAWVGTYDWRLPCRVALVFDLPFDLDQLVRAMRRDLATFFDRAQFEPHLTLLYLGEFPGDEVSRLARLFHAYRAVVANAELTGYGIFETSVGANLHLTVNTSMGLGDLHRRVIGSFEADGYARQTRYLGDDWLAHITVAEGFRGTLRDAADVSPPLPAASFALSTPHLLVTQNLKSEELHPHDALRSTEGLSEIRARLEPVPALLDAFDACQEALAQGPCRSLAVTGSLATGHVDAVSDIDLSLVYDPAISRQAVHGWIATQLGTIGTIAAQFPASHIGKPELLVTFLVRDGSLIKIDVDCQSAAYRLPAHGIVVSEFPGREQAAPEGPASRFDQGDLAHRFVGWLWYTGTKIARGELLEAADSLHVISSRVLVPMLQITAGLPFEGHRRLESRMAPPDLARLLRCRPAELTRSSLSDALFDSLEFGNDLFSAAGQGTDGRFGAPDLGPVTSALEDLAGRASRDRHGAGLSSG